MGFFLAGIGQLHNILRVDGPPPPYRKVDYSTTLWTAFQGAKRHKVRSTSGTLRVCKFQEPDDPVGHIARRNRHNVRATSGLLDLGTPFHCPEHIYLLFPTYRI